MATVKQTIDIEAPVEKVYSFIADHPDGATAFIPGLNRITNVTPAKAGVDQTWDYEFNWFGLVISGHSRCTTFDRPRTYQFKTETGNRSIWTYHFEPRGDGTRLALEVEYDIPQTMLARVATQGVLEKMNQERATETVGNLKALVEA